MRTRLLAKPSIHTSWKIHPIFLSHCSLYICSLSVCSMLCRALCHSHDVASPVNMIHGPFSHSVCIYINISWDIFFVLCAILFILQREEKKTQLSLLTNSSLAFALAMYDLYTYIHSFMIMFDLSFFVFFFQFFLPPLHSWYSVAFFSVLFPGCSDTFLFLLLLPWLQPWIQRDRKNIQLIDYPFAFWRLSKCMQKG